MSKAKHPQKNDIVSLPPRVALLLLLASDHYDFNSPTGHSHTEAVARGVKEAGSKYEVSVDHETHTLLLTQQTNVDHDGKVKDVFQHRFPLPLPPIRVRSV